MQKWGEAEEVDARVKSIRFPPKNSDDDDDQMTLL